MNCLILGVDVVAEFQAQGHPVTHPVVDAASERLHLWFTSVVNSGELRVQLQRLARLVRWVDWGLAALLLTGAATVATGHMAWSALLAALAIGIFVTSLIIEPATTAAAFGKPGMTRYWFVIQFFSRK